MNLEKAVYRVAMVVWMGLAVGAWIAVDLGYTEPWLTFADVPGGSTGGFAAALGVTVLGWVVVGRLDARRERGDWLATGREAGFSPADDPGDRSGPKLTGTVDGRTVGAVYDKRTVSSNVEGSNERVTFVHAHLDEASEYGVVVGPAGSSVDAGVGTLDFDEMAETAAEIPGLVTAQSDGLVVVGTSAPGVEAVSSGRSGDAVRAVADLEVAAVGDAAGVVEDWAEARDEAFEGSIVGVPVENLVDRVPGDAATATIETEAAMTDGDELRRFAAGAVAIADAFEAATEHSRTTQ